MSTDPLEAQEPEPLTCQVFPADADELADARRQGARVGCCCASAIWGLPLLLAPIVWLSGESFEDPWALPFCALLIAAVTGIAAWSTRREAAQAPAEAGKEAEAWIPRVAGAELLAAAPAQLWLGEGETPAHLPGTLVLCAEGQAFLSEAPRGRRLLWLPEPLATAPPYGKPLAWPLSLLAPKRPPALACGPLRLTLPVSGAAVLRWLEERGRLAAAPGQEPAAPAEEAWSLLEREDPRRSRLRLVPGPLRQGLLLALPIAALALLFVNWPPALVVGGVAGLFHAVGSWLREQPRPVRYLGVVAASAGALATWALLAAQVAYSEAIAVNGVDGAAWDAASAAALALAQPVVADPVAEIVRAVGWGAVLGAGLSVAWRARAPLAGLVALGLVLPLPLALWFSGGSDLLGPALALLAGAAFPTLGLLVVLGGGAEYLDRWFLLRRESDAPPSFAEVVRTQDAQRSSERADAAEA